MIGAINDALIFLISTLVDLYVFVLIFRVILVWLHADYYNPITQMVNKLTYRIINPLKRFIPNIKRVELASVILVIVLETIKFFLIGMIAFSLSNPFGLILLAFADTLKLTINIFFYAILIQVFLSWVTSSYSPINTFLTLITSPIMRPLQRIFPPVSGFDISPIPALIGLQLIIILLVNPIYKLGMVVAFG